MITSSLSSRSALWFDLLCYSHLQDKKFNTGSDGNWRPEDNGTSVQRSSNWEDGLGRGDIEKNRKERRRLESKRDANERYHAQIIRDSVDKQQKEQARQEYHRWEASPIYQSSIVFLFFQISGILLFHCRKKVDERTRQISEQSAEKARQESQRMEHKRQSTERVCKKEQERQEKADTWKQSRIEAMKERRTQHEEMENSYERAAQEQESQRLVSVESKRLINPCEEKFVEIYVSRTRRKYFRDVVENFYY